MSTQLRLVTGEGAEPRSSGRARRPSTPLPARRARLGPRLGGRATAVWDDDWRLDAATRRVGRQGVAAARAALARAHRPEPGPPLRQAS